MLFLGSFPPQPHRWCMPFYYPNWINDFWRIMGLIHFGDKDHFCIPAEKRFDEGLIRRFCSEAGLAFYDTACEVRRLKDKASDAYLEVVTPTDIPALLRRIPQCRALITTGEKATGVLAEQLGCPVPAVGGFVEVPRSVVMADSLDSQGFSDSGLAAGLNSEVDAGLDSGLDSELDSGPAPGHDVLRFWRMPSSSRAYPLPLAQKTAFYRRLFG